MYDFSKEFTPEEIASFTGSDGVRDSVKVARLRSDKIRHAGSLSEQARKEMEDKYVFSTDGIAVGVPKGFAKEFPEEMEYEKKRIGAMHSSQFWRGNIPKYARQSGSELPESL